MADRSSLILTDLDATVMGVAAAWPDDEPLVMLHSGTPHQQWGRWSVLAQPQRFVQYTADSGWIESTPAGEQRGLDLPRSGLAGLPQLTAPAHGLSPADDAPFCGGFIGCLAYELAGEIEPAARVRATSLNPDTWPLIDLAHCPAALVHDNVHNTWRGVGERAAVEAMLEQLDLSRARAETWRAGEIVNCTAPEAHLDAVARTLEYISAGDIFQANLTHQLAAPFRGCTRELAMHSLRTSGARYGAYMELPGGRCIVSMSPELFLDIDMHSRRIVTRPIKGTLPQSAPADRLLHSAKDAAELTMIVDLMRNDLGRVCDFSTVAVTEPRCIETHTTVHHGVSTVTGMLRSGVTLADILAATFPAGSITGAPKIRAMQIIEELEQRQRGPYCGAIGMFSACGRSILNVAIRTMVMTGRREHDRWDMLDGTITYGVGGGIVADSIPIAEYRESLDKAAILRLALTAPNQQPSPAVSG